VGEDRNKETIMIKIRSFRGLAGAVIPLALGTGLALGAAAVPAQALSAVHTYTVPVSGPQGFQPPGLSLDALDWAGTGNNGTCTTGAAQVNSLVGFWRAGATHAGCAADFTEVAVTAAVPGGEPAGTTAVQLQYAPGGLVNASMCVSTVTDVQGAFARLRGCVAGGNPWQDFLLIPKGDGLFQIQAFTGPLPAAGTDGAVAPGYFLNDKRFGGNGTPAISWTSTTGENQLFDRA
jgi:hypothetical protein